MLNFALDIFCIYRYTYIVERSNALIFGSFEWTEGNTGHIARHNVTPDEAEEACFNSPSVFRGRRNRYFVLGQTDAGRYLTVILEYRPRRTVRVITARDMTGTERKRYKRR